MQQTDSWERLLTAQPSPLQPWLDPLFQEKGVSVFVKRDDLLAWSPANALCGNKWRKLKYNLLHARQNHYQTLLSFGGAVSNHLAALESAGSVFGFQTVGIVRGVEETLPPLHPDTQNGFNPIPNHHSTSIRIGISREQYREKDISALHPFLLEKYGSYYVIPEGGTNALAVEGCEELGREILEQCPDVTDILVAGGTGGTAAGLLRATWQQGVKTHVYPALKGGDFAAEIHPFIPQEARENLVVDARWHFGGYARYKPALGVFMHDFYARNRIALDPVYTGKLCFGVREKVSGDGFTPNSTLVVVHTGGLQGVPAFNARYDLHLPLS